LLKFTDDFIDRLKECPCNESHNMVIFDVAPLFTNVSLTQTIELTINRSYTDNNLDAIHFEKHVFRK